MMLARTAIGLGILGVIVAAGAGRAHAMCAWPSWYGTPAGVAVPETGVLYRYDGDATVAKRYDAAAAREAGFVVDPGWTAPAEAPRVLAIQRSTYRWTCSEEDALAIQLDQPVAAVRVFWATSEGQHETIVAPRPAETPKGRPAAILKLGRLDCAGENVPVADLERGVVLGLTAIRHDGSEVPIDGVPAIVALGDFPAARRLAPLGFGVIAADAAVAEDAAPWRPRTNGAFPIALVLGAVVLGVRRGLAGAADATVALPEARTRRG